MHNTLGGLVDFPVDHSERKGKEPGGRRGEKKCGWKDVRGGRGRRRTKLGHGWKIRRGRKETRELSLSLLCGELNK